MQCSTVCRTLLIPASIFQSPLGRNMNKKGYCLLLTDEETEAQSSWLAAEGHSEGGDKHTTWKSPATMLPGSPLLTDCTSFPKPRSGAQIPLCRFRNAASSPPSCLTWPFQKPKMNGSKFCLENFATPFTRAGCKTRLGDPC